MSANVTKVIAVLTAPGVMLNMVYVTLLLVNANVTKLRVKMLPLRDRCGQEKAATKKHA